VYVVKVKVCTTINSPVLPKSTVFRLIKLYGLEHKYKVNSAPDKNLAHLDGLFFRAVDPITGELKPYIRGSSVFGAIKSALGLKGENLDYPTVYGIYFDEEHVVLDSKRITTLDGRPSVTVNEVVVPGAEGYLIIGDLPPEDMRPSTVQIGSWRKKGYGLVKILWGESVRVAKPDKNKKKKK